MNHFADTRPSRSLLAEFSKIGSECARLETEIERLDIERNRRQSAIDKLDASIREQETRLKQASWRLRLARTRFIAQRFLAKALQNADVMIGRRGATPIIGSLCAAGVLVGMNLLGFPGRLQALGAACAGLAGMVGWLLATRLPESDKLDGWVSKKGAVVTDLTSIHNAMVREINAARNQAASERSELAIFAESFEKSRERVRDVHLKREDTRHRSEWYQWLCNQDFALMASLDFERYLGDLFEFLGYSVELTGKSGDQGADLIVAKNGRRICIQAKKYAGSVGNWAVQEAHAAKDMYRCQASAVITTSYFTRSARELADGVGCALIQGDQIRDLIDGKLVL